MNALSILIPYGMIAIWAIILMVSLYKADNAKNKPNQP